MKVLLVDGFESTHALPTAAQATLQASGHDVTVLRLVDAGFAEFMSAQERSAYHEVDNLVTSPQRESAALVKSHDALLVCGPTFEGTVAPTVKSWFERVFIPEVSFTFTKSGRVTGALGNFKRVGMFVESPDSDPWTHRRRSSTRSMLRSVRMNSAKTCRMTYLAVEPTDDISTAVTKALARW